MPPISPPERKAEPPQPERRLRALVCGYGHLGLAILQGLLTRADICEVIGVFRWTSRPATVGIWEPVEDVFRDLIKSSGIPDLACQGINSYEFTALLEEMKPDIIFIGAWGEIIKPHLIDRPNLLLVNCHPSRLPAHRGANPYSSVIREQETETGVTFHLIVPEIDAGAILMQRTVPIDPLNDTGAHVRDRCVAAACEILPDLAGRLHAHIVHHTPLEAQAQDESQKSYFPALKPEHGLVDWQDSPDVIYRQYRALYPWIVCYGHLGGKRKVLFYDPRFTPPSPQDRPGQPPGTIVHYNLGTFRITLNHPDWVMEVSNFQIEGGRSLLPMQLGRLLSPFFLHAGQRFLPPVFSQSPAGEPPINKKI